MVIAAVHQNQVSLRDVLQAYNQIIIPDVQRDYVMGSGNKKLLKLLHAIAESNEKIENFNFSCLVGYKDENNNLYIYDGQQRLATLVVLCSYLLDKTNAENKKMLEKFSFTNRETANKWLSDPTMINELDAVDFTTYSLAQLIKVFKSQSFYQNYKYIKFLEKINFDFLFNKVMFNIILVNEINDAEQFFLDINDGLDLKSYELYKAELFHHASTIIWKSDKDKEFKRFALKLENKWLKFFMNFKYKKNNEIHCEEEMLIYFLKYCFHMLWIEENENDEMDDFNTISWLTREHLQRVDKIIDSIIAELDGKNAGDITCIDYSTSNQDFTTRGQHWSISDLNYNAMLKTFLSNVHNEDTHKDVIIWSYISNLSTAGQNKDTLYKYLRFLKKLLNNNRAENLYAKILFCDWGVDSKEIIYSRYYVKGIPEYYTGHKVACDEGTLNFINSLIVLNYKYMCSPDKKFLNIYLQESKSSFLNDILKREQKKHNSVQKELIEKYENLKFLNGLVDNILIYSEESCYLKSIFNENFYNEVINNGIWKINLQYKAILYFISMSNINLIIFEDVTILWNNYNPNGAVHKSEGSLIPHNWCDLFTSEQGLEKSLEYKYLDSFKRLPDGWISERKVFQPKDNIYTENEKRGFAARGYMHSVGDMENFMGNF
ncbi:DUF262 domain-containing protein [Lysinibacillus capsici]|uniref:DUF262 domain-containing protein n=1 Tax=Lysinibacillus capsici TaxID=2115968 RepID=UPI0032E3BC1F